MSHEQISLLDENYRYEVAEQQFRDNREPRCPVIMIYDCSRSMQGGLMDEVKRGHELLQQELLEDSIASLRADMSYILYGSEVDPPSLFATALESASMPEETRPSNLNFRDMLGTSTNTAILTAIDVVEERLKHYGNKVPHYAPMIFLITDGESLDDNLPHESGKTMRQAAIEALEKRVAFAPGSRLSLCVIARLSRVSGFLCRSIFLRVTLRRIRRCVSLCRITRPPRRLFLFRLTQAI